MWEYDLPTGRSFWSSERYDLFGIRRDREPPKLLDVLDLAHPEDRPHVRAAFEAVMATGGAFDVEFRITKPGAGEVWISSVGSVALDGNGKAAVVRGVDRDITDRKEAEEISQRDEAGVAKLHAEGQRALRARDHVVSAFAHDLRNPLASIVTQTALLLRQVQRGGVEASNLEAALGRIGHASTEMEYLIEDLHDFARLQSGRPIQLGRQRVDLGKIVTRVIEKRRRLGATQNILLLVPDDSAVDGAWDARRLERLAHHLVSNALAHSRQSGEVVVSVERRRESTEEWAYLIVSDAGFGFAESDLPRLFEWFPGEEAGGSGARTHVGLAAARQIAELHGGSISVKSASGKGSTFEVRLPLGDVASAH